MANEQSYDNQQLAITQQAQRQQQAEQRAAEQANRQATRRAGGANDVTNPVQGLPKVQYTSLPPTSGANVSAKSRKKG